MSRIAGEFCTWLRDLPGEDNKVALHWHSHFFLIVIVIFMIVIVGPVQYKTWITMTKVNRMGEEHLRALFDTAQSANPGTTKLAEGLR